jgi:peptidylprolyl isomerase
MDLMGGIFGVCSHVVFGTVLEGMDVVYKIESMGSNSGQTSAKVVIADSGELPATIQ